MAESKPVSTPMDINVKLVKGNKGAGVEVSKLSHREFIGALSYLAVFTRPDIAFAVSSLSQYNGCYDQSH